MARSADEVSHNKRWGTVFDQHDRPWVGYIDNKSGYPVGVLQPKGWRAPWLPPQGTNTFIFDKDQPSRFRINYEGIFEERMAALKEWETLRTDKAVARGWNPDDPEKQEMLDKMVGHRSGVQAPEVIAACMQNEPWVLGLSDVVNKKVEQYLEKKLDRRATLLKGMPDFTAVDEDVMEDLLDIEDQVDPLPAAKKPKREKVKA